MTCKLCNKNKKLIKAHIIPESFFITLKDPEDEPLQLFQKGVPYPKRSPIGPYDSTILCEDCEKSFCEWDNYARYLLIDQRVNAIEIPYGKYRILQFENVDYVKLKLFFISMFWRAGVSSHPYYAKVTLGPFERVLRQMIVAAHPGLHDQFSFFLTIFNESNPNVGFSPYHGRYDGVNYFAFCLDKYIVRIKSDTRPTPESLCFLDFSSGSPLYILRRDLLRDLKPKTIREILGD